MRKRIALMMLVLFVFAPMLFAAIQLTEAEQEYVKSRSPVRAVSVDGSAPLQYRDSRGLNRGISFKVLDEISNRTGLVFEYQMYDKISDLRNCYTDGTDIFFGIPDQYTKPGYKLSRPYLQSQTIFFANISVKPNELENKRFAATQSSPLPEGVREDQAIYFETRQKAILAVHEGAADFGYGNAYSLAYYTLQYDLRDIYSIPQGKEERLYRMQFIKDDPLLFSIIDKGIASITAQEMQTIVLEATSQVERIITLPMILDAYGAAILTLGTLIILILAGALVAIQTSRTTLRFEREKFRTIAEVSTEYLFEYDAKGNTIILYEKFSILCASDKAVQEVKKLLRENLSNQAVGEVVASITLPLGDACPNFFRLTAKKVLSQKGKRPIWIGKLQDISKEVEHQKSLESLAQLDGLTGLLNARTLRSQLSDRLIQKPITEMDFCILFDIDSFKEINDSFGHLHGDKVLQALGSILNTPRYCEHAIIGRIGGDEFCCYLTNASSEQEAIAYCTSLMQDINRKLQVENVTISLGITQVRDHESIEELYTRTDQSMYEAKHKGKNRIALTAI